MTLYPEDYKFDTTRVYESRGVKTRELMVYLDVSSVYRPHISFYCYTSESGLYWGITSIYYVTLVRSYNNLTKTFSGELNAWLRSPYQIEYMINGDFYNNGTQTVEVQIQGNFQLNDAVKMGGAISFAYTSSHFGYYYKHETKSFQS